LNFASMMARPLYDAREHTTAQIAEVLGVPLARAAAAAAVPLRTAEGWFAPYRRGGLTALHKLVGRYAKAAGIPARLAHPHVLRAFYATTLAGEGVPVHVIARRLGHASIETTNRYLAEIADDTTSVGDVLDRRHQSGSASGCVPDALSAKSCSVLPQTPCSTTTDRVE